MIGRIGRVEHHYRLHNGEKEATTASLKIAVHPPSDGRELPAMPDQPSSSSVPKPGAQLNEPDVGPAFEPYQRPAGGRSRSNTITGWAAKKPFTRHVCSAFPYPDDDRGRAAGQRPAHAGYGTGSELRQALGYAIVGGLLISQLLTLFTIDPAKWAFDLAARCASFSRSIVSLL
jgi:hypothetical protein